MNIVIKKPFFIIMALLIGVAFMASCSKEPEAKAEKKGKKAPVTAKAKSISPDAKNTFTAVRNGQYVNLNWHIDATGFAGGKIKQIDIIRNATGTKKGQNKVATLKSDASSYVDCLPDENAYWYSIKLLMENGKSLAIGPVRVAPDKAGAYQYIKQDDKYKISITRTDDIATLQWDFIENEYDSIRVMRYPRSVSEPFKGKDNGVPIVRTVERKSQYTDALPDANSDYWYWFRITLKSGAIIYKGPIKAEYINQ